MMKLGINTPSLRLARVTSLALAGAAFSASGFAAATITIVNGDPANVGFNDPTVVAPVGGNAGTTLGAQRLNAFQSAADKWGATLTSSVTVRVLATWEALSCTATGNVLGSAGATQIWNNFTGAIKANTWYGKAQTGKLSGVDPDPTTADIRARFNVNLGTAACTGSGWYYGLDNNHGASIDLVTVLTHEFGHGLGFQTYTSGSTGAQNSGLPSIWDWYLTDTTTGKLWKDMTNAERAASSLKSANLAWGGSIVNTALPGVLQAGTPLLTVSAPPAAAGAYQVGTASFGAALSSPGLTKQIVSFVDTAATPTSAALGLACNPLSAANAAIVAGRIAIADRGVCGFIVKVKNLQNAGAVAAIIADNTAGSPPAGLGGTDATITIPSVRVTLPDGAKLKTALATRTRSTPTMSGNLGLNLAVRAGADLAGRMLMYAPNPFQSGSSVSHFDVSAFPNQLMEPAINGDLTHEVTPPNDLSFPLLQDIGW